MDGLTKATTESRARGQRKVLVLSAGTGVAALAVTGFLTVGLGSSATDAATSTTTSPTSTTTTTDDNGTSSVTTTQQAPVATSGGS